MLCTVSLLLSMSKPKMCQAKRQSAATIFKGDEHRLNGKNELVASWQAIIMNTQLCCGLSRA